MRARILLVEDDRSIAAVIEAALNEEGHQVTVAPSIARRDTVLAADRFDCMLTDVMLGDGDGLDNLAAALSAHRDMPVIVLSAQNTFDTAVRASEIDAFEYFPKPFDLDELVRAVAQAVARRGSGADAGEEPEQPLPFIGRSPAMQGVYRMITRVLRNDLTVLVTGESGTGKELVAEAIHQLGHRRAAPFVAVNAAAIPRDLVESELFGHERGAFTGAVTQAIGKFEQANGGTLFLDEIGDMPPEAQTRLLRALQTGRIRRVGGRQEISVDVRIVAATNRALDDAISAGSFREDLYYRLAVVPIHLPPLRERAEDIGALARHFLIQAEREGLPRRALDDGAVEALTSRPWRGNVRELRNAMFRLALVAREERIDRAFVESTLGVAASPAPADGAGFAQALRVWLDTAAPADGTLYHSALAELEAPLFTHVLQRTGGNQIAAARILGINRNTLRKRLSELAPKGVGRI